MTFVDRTLSNSDSRLWNQIAAQRVAIAPTEEVEAVPLHHQRKGVTMSRRAILSLAASAIIGIGILGTISTDASAYRAVYRGGVYRGGVYRGGVYRGGYYRGVRPGVAVGVGAAAVGAAAVGAAAAGAYYAPGYYGAPAPVACGYGYYWYAPYGRCVPTPN